MKLQGFEGFKKIAEGRERVVYSGVRTSDQKPFVFKTLRSEHPSSDAIAMMYHEYEIAKDLRCPSILEVYELIHDQNQYMLVEEDMQGISMQEYLKKHPITDLKVFFRLAIQMTRALAEVHARHIIHKDINPGNFIIEPKSLLVKLTDFNFSTKLLHEVQFIVPPSKLEGTLLYMAPEQSGRMNMNIDYRADFYSLGVSFFEILAGRCPFNYSDPLELVHAHLAEPVPELNSPVRDIVYKLMAKNPSDRYQSAIGIQADLEKCQKGEVFVPGQEDVFDRLNLSQKLYGRLEEAKVLLTAYERASQGAVEALMVCGYSGIGKTTLINEVHKSMVRDKGYYITGKFDQLAHNTPYTAMTQAFNEVARLILAEPEARFEAIKKELQEALGGVAQVIIDLAPDMELILGPQPPLEQLGPTETLNRMMIFFKRFMKVIANKDHPLVMFIDDLQWIDSGSQRQLECILTDEELSHVLLIGAYRNNEVGEDHPIKQLKVPTLTLGPLTISDYEALFRDSFNREDKSFAELIHKRTEGNPFFCKQVINTLYKEKLLFFDYANRRWDWNLNEIVALKITDNVVDLMLGKLAELPQNTQEILKYAACIGNRFTINRLKLVCGNDVADALQPALQEELLFTARMGEKSFFHFAHDRVQQAAYQGIALEDKKKIHLSLARLLLEKEPDNIFGIVDHFDHACGLLEGSERLEVAKLNYRAALKARGANAYQPMSNYLKIALELLGETGPYDLTYPINCEYAWSLYFLGKLEEAQKLVTTLLKKAKSNLDQVKIGRLRVKLYSVRGEYNEAIDVLINGLKLLGVKLVKNPTKFRVILEWIRSRWLLRRFQIDRLEKELSRIVDPEMLMVFDLLDEAFYPFVWKGGMNSPYLGLFSWNLMLSKGMPRGATTIITNYAAIYRYFSKDVDELFQYWGLTERVFAEFQDKSLMSQAYYSYVAAIGGLRNPIPNLIKVVALATQYASETGNFAALGILNSFIVRTTRFQGTLNKSSLAAQKTVRVCQEGSLKDLADLTELSLLLQKIQMAEISVSEEQLNSLEQKVISSQGQSLKGLMFMDLSTFYYSSGNFTQAVDFHWKWYKVIPGLIQLVLAGEYSKAIDVLSIIKCLRSASFGKRWVYQKRIRLILSELKWLAGHQPGNFLHCYLCARGAWMHWKGDYFKALKDFDEAIENAKKGEFYLWIAMANELAGEMLIEYKQPKAAKEYIREAIYYYDRYGMKLKVNILRKRYPQYHLEEQEVHSSTSISATTSASLDFLSVIKASQAISGEIIIDKLFEKMLHILVENAGAEKAYFLEHVKEAWMVTAGLSPTFNMLNIPFKEFIDIPQTLIQFAIRSKETVVLQNATENNKYQQDPYFTRTLAKSVMCLPVIHQEKTLGIIYLENNKTGGAFTQERVTVLKTLAAQIAISLENARQLEHLANLNKMTERFVPKPFLKLLHKESVEEVKLGDSVKKNISILFNDIRSFTSLVESREPENAFAFVNRYWEFMAPVIRKHHGYIDQYQGDAILAIFPEKPEDAVLASIEMMKQLSNFNKRQKALNDVEISMGIGVSTGEAMLGVIGEKERQVSGLISDVANTAARTEGLNKLYGSRILITGSTKEALPIGHNYYLRKVDKVRLKGKVAVTEIYEIIEWESRLSGISLPDYIALYEAAFQKYQAADFDGAITLLRQCFTHYPTDSAAKVLMDRCKIFFLEGAPKEWDGTFTLTSK